MPANLLVKSISLKYIVSVKQIKVSKAIPEVFLLPSLKVKKLTKLLKLAMISTALFQYLTKQKNVEIFALFIQNLEYQLNKIKKLVTNLAMKMPQCYHDFLDIFSKENSDKVAPHSKYDYKIKLLNSGKNHGQTALHSISKPQLEFVK